MTGLRSALNVSLHPGYKRTRKELKISLREAILEHESSCYILERRSAPLAKDGRDTVPGQRAPGGARGELRTY